VIEVSASLLDEIKNDPDILARILKHLGKTVVRDEVVKKIIVLTGVSAYSDDPINLFLRGPSSIGKTYNVREALKYFPQEDVWYLGGLSPTALIHDYGVLVDENGNPISFLEKPRKADYKDERGKLDRVAYQNALNAWEEKIRKSRTLIDLHNKILIFLEAPRLETYNMLRPLLSHDKREISYKFTDKTSKGMLRTSHVVLSGWPACIFCTTDIKYIEDLATRGFTITPEMSVEKYREACMLQAKMDTSPFTWVEYDQELDLIRNYISTLASYAKIAKSRYAFKVLIPYAEKLAEVYPAEYSRDMRDFARFRSLIKVNAMLHYPMRPQLIIEKNGKKQRFLIATTKDLEVAYSIFTELHETTRTGIPGNVLDFFHNILEPLYKSNGPLHYSTLAEAYNREHARTVSSRTIRDWCQLLADIGWVDITPDPDDKRKKLVSVIKKNSGILEIYGGTEFNDLFGLKNLKEWFIRLKNIAEINGSHIYIKFLDIVIDNPEKFSIIEDPKISAIFSANLNALNQKIKPKKSLNYELPEFSKSFKSEKEASEKSSPQASNQKITVEKEEKSEPPDFSEFSKHVVGIKRLRLTEFGECWLCHRTPVELTHICETFTGSSQLVCEDCALQIKRQIRSEMMPEETAHAEEAEQAEEKSCLRCVHLTRLDGDPRPFCVRLNAFLTEESMSQSCDFYEPKPEPDDDQMVRQWELWKEEA